jgi:hypothetical protein
VELLAERDAEQSTQYAAEHEQACNPPVHQSGERVAHRGGHAERRDRHQRRADGVDDRHARCGDQSRHDEEAAADTEEAGERAHPDAESGQ